MRVTFITNVYPNVFGKSDGIFVHEQAKMMMERGFQVDVLYIDLRSVKKKRRWGKKEEQIEGVHVLHYSLPCGPIPILYEILYLLLEEWALFKYIAESGAPEILHGHFYINGLFFKKIKKKYNIRTIITEHSSELYQKRISLLHKCIMKKSYNHADCIIAVSEALKKRVELYTSREVKVVHNVVSEEFYYKSNTRSDFVFLFVGHLVENKGIRLLLECFEEVQQSMSNVALTVVGDGILKKELVAYASKKHLNVNFLGEVAHERLPDIYRQSNCFVLPSRMETFGVAYVEALACGLPVIATRCGGPEEFVNEENGILINIESKEELCEAMQKMKCEIDCYVGEKISIDALKKFGKTAVSQALTELYLKGR